MLSITLINTLTVTKEEEMLGEFQYYKLQNINLKCLLS